MIEPPLPEDAGAPDAGAERAARQGRALQQLAEIGMAMARGLQERMAAAAGADEACELALAFTRVAKSVRLTIALEARLADDQQLRAETLAARASQARTAAVADREARVEANTIRVSDAVEMAIVAHTAEFDDGGYASEKLSERLSEHLKDRRETESFADIPVSVAVAQVCKALGVSIDWDLWRNEDWAFEEWRVRTPGSPYVEGPSADSARTGRSAPWEDPADPPERDTGNGVQTRGPPMRRSS
jgi:hypothetical protein